MRSDLSEDSQDLIVSGRAVLIMLVELFFTSGVLRLATTRGNVIDTLDSPTRTFYGISMGELSAVEDKLREPTAMTISLSGANPALIAVALGEQVRGRPVKLYTGLIDQATGTLYDIYQIWAGQMATMKISQKDDKAAITLACEHRGVLFSRTKAVRYTDADQQRIYSGDRSLEFIVSQSQVQDVWPAAGFFRQ